jgi:hypothetical protein
MHATPRDNATMPSCADGRGASHVVCHDAFRPKTEDPTLSQPRPSREGRYGFEPMWWSLMAVELRHVGPKNAVCFGRHFTLSEE